MDSSKIGMFNLDLSVGCTCMLLVGERSYNWNGNFMIASLIRYYIYTETPFAEHAKTVTSKMNEK